MIRNRYRYQLFIDDLPNSTLLRDPVTDEHIENFKEGIFVGNHNKDGSIYIHNHLEFIVKVHHVHGGDEVRIVGFEVEQHSIATGSSLDPQFLHRQPKQYLRTSTGKLTDISEGILFSYSWKTVNDESTTWKHRLDHYYEMGKYDVHMKQIVISLGIMAFTAFTAGMYVKRSITRDFALLAGGEGSSTVRSRNSALSSIQDNEGRNLVGGLEIVSDAAE